MTFFSALGACILFSLACNLDTALLAMGHGAKGNRLGAAAALVLAAVTTAVTFLSLVLGAAGAALLPAALAGRLGGAALMGMGLWYLLDFLRGQTGAAPPATGTGLVALGASLAVNNAGVGVAAGITGLSPLLASVCNFLVTLLTLSLGRRLGERLARWSALALPLSGVLLVGLGLWQFLGKL